MDILDDMGVSKLSAKVFSKVNYSFKSGTSCSVMLSLAYVYIEKQWKCSEMEWKNFFFLVLCFNITKLPKLI